MSVLQTFGAVTHLTPFLFRPIRRAAGPLHRRRRSLDDDPNQQYPALPPPWTDERWFRGDFPPRTHNAVQLLHDGESYLGDLHAALLAARERVTIAGWCLTPLVPLLRDNNVEDSILADVLNDVSKRVEVYVLLWSGSPALFAPTQRETEEARKTLLERAPHVRCELDHRAPFSHDHHQKAVTIDGRVAYVGGMDLTTYEGDRWDTHDHLLRFGPNWHDAQLQLRGELVQDVEQNFCQRWNAVTGDHLQPVEPPPPDPSWNTHAQVVRTIPKGFYPFAPEGIHGIYHAITTAIRGAQRFVYLENQYIWAPEVMDALLDAMRRPRTTPFRVILVLPARAQEGRYDNDDHVRQLMAEDNGRGVVHVYSLYTGGPATGVRAFSYRPVYVHAKVSIVDDEWFCAGSANLNRRGLATDTEMDVQCIAPDLARSARIHLWSRHLHMTEEQIAAVDPIELIDHQWKSTAEAMERAVRNGMLPPRSRTRIYVPGRNPGSRLLDLIQTLTLEH